MSDDTTAADTTAAPAAAPPAKPAPLRTEVPVTTATHTEPAQDQGPVPYSRLAELNRKHQEEAVARAAAEARAAAAEESSASLEREASKWKTRHERDLAYVDFRDRPNLQAPEVREFVEQQYAGYAARDADAAKPFGEWLHEVAPLNPLIAPHLAAPTEPGTVARPAPPSLDRGVKGATSPPVVELPTHAEIQRRKRAGTWTPQDAINLARAAGWVKGD